MEDWKSGTRCKSFGCVSRLEEKMRVENEGGVAAQIFEEGKEKNVGLLIKLMA